MYNRPIVVASNVLISPYGLTLLGRRTDCGLWEVSGGKVEDGENIVNAGRREHLEETGMELLDDNPTFLGYSLRPGSNKKTEKQLFLCMFYLWKEWNNSPELVDGSHTEWKWFDLTNLPKPSDCTYGTRQFIEEMLPNYLQKKLIRFQLADKVRDFMIKKELAFEDFNGVPWDWNGTYHNIASPREKQLFDLTDKEVWDTISFIISDLMKS
jgi:ADP-ribose pyrophosphatase YjhB (NUDIX family)